jgi:hypothetical protein
MNEDRVSPEMEKLKALARGELHRVVEVYLNSPKGFVCLEPWSYDWETTRESLPADLGSYLRIYKDEVKDG